MLLCLPYFLAVLPPTMDVTVSNATLNVFNQMTAFLNYLNSVKPIAFMYLVMPISRASS